MNNTTQNNKRIAKNTIMLYFRMILLMLVSLYTSRVVLDYLGVIDYGIYNVVGGIVVMLSFFNSTMSHATQRFLSFELARGNENKLKQTFAASLNIHILICIIVVVLAESIGLYFLNNYLNIPEEKYLAANIVYQCSIITFCINLIQIPYNASLIAHENMNIYAYLSMLEAGLKLGIVYILLLFEKDRLIIYGILIVIVQITVRLIYQIYCKKKYKECCFLLFLDKTQYKKILGFAVWSMFGSFAWLLRDQGINIVLNIFFGPVVNAAKAISNQVSGAVITFVSNFLTALNPQITKNYALGNLHEMEKLTYMGIKYSYGLVMLIACPIVLNINIILGLWLKEVPNYSDMFIILIITDIVLGTLMGANPILTALSATGNIKKAQISVSSIILLILPTSYIILKHGATPYSVFYVYLFYTLIAGIVRLYFSKKIIGFSLSLYFKSVFFPLITITFTTIPFLIFIKTKVIYNIPPIVELLVMTIISSILILTFFWIIAMKSSEKQYILTIIKNKLKR